ncbi:MAG: type II secretion system F family protein [Actinobacteria bacterium]|nr:type II secretion system F family protein [Actinomycetota bacterium]
MRWFAAGIFMILSIYFLWLRSSARERARALKRMKKHLGPPGKEKGPGIPGRLLSRIEWLDRARYVRRLRVLFESAAVDMGWARFKLVWLAFLFLLPAVSYAVSGSPLMIPPAAVAAFFIPIPLLKSLRRRGESKAAEKSEQFAADLALYLRCGIPAEEAIGLLAPDYAPALTGQLALFQKEVAVSSRPDEALLNLAKTLGSPDLDLIAQAVITSRETGSDITGVMEAVGEALRERVAIRRELHTQTIQSRLSGRIVAALPLVFLGLSAMISRGTLSVVFGTVPGLLMLAAAVVLDVLGFLWIRRILDIKTKG